MEILSAGSKYEISGHHFNITQQNSRKFSNELAYLWKLLNQPVSLRDRDRVAMHEKMIEELSEDSLIEETEAHILV